MDDPGTEEIRILHVDDNPDVSSLTTSFLERENNQFRTDTLTNPREALERLGSDDVDCLVCDYEMPEMDGIELLRSVREDFPDLPFILFTGKGSEEVASEAISAGVTDYLQKRTATEQYQLLANRIENAVSQYRSERRAERQERIISLLQRLNQEMVNATTREEIEEAVTDILAHEDPYLLAWIGHYDDDRERIVPNVAAGKSAGEITPKNVTIGDEASRGAIHEVVASKDITVGDSPDPSLELWPDDESVAYDAAIVVPVSYHEESQGILTVYATDEEIFSRSEFDMFKELSGDLGQALHTVETHRRLRRHRSAIEAIPDGILVLDEQAHIVLANEPAAGLIDQTPEELEGAAFPRFVEEEIVDEDIIDWYVDALRGLLSTSSDKEAAWYETTIHPVGDGSRTIEVHLSLRPFDEEFRGSVAVLREITDRKRREQELEESRERYRRLVEEAPVAIAMYQRDGELVFVNDAAVELVDATDQDSLLGRSAFDYVHEDDLDMASRRVTRVVEEQVPSPETQLTLVDENGNEKYVQLRSVPVSYRGEAAGQAVIKDITELKQREKELQRQRDRLDEFASFVSHDLRNPLEVLRGRLELAAEGRDDPDLEAALDAQERMATLIESVLRFTRRNEAALDTEPVDLETIAREAWLHVSTSGTDLVIASNGTLTGHPDLIKDLLENLFQNAITHGETTETVTVGALPEDDGFYVADDGSGIPPEDSDQIFDYGYSTDSDGSGFGLAIAQRISEFHGLDISLTESEGGGARFTFRKDGSRE